MAVTGLSCQATDPLGTLTYQLTRMVSMATDAPIHENMLPSIAKLLIDLS